MEIPGNAEVISLDNAESYTIILAGYKVKVSKAPAGSYIDIRDELVNPDHFHADTRVHYMIEFDGMFESLIGVDQEAWKERGEEGIDVLTERLEDAQNIILNISAIAKQVVSDINLYKDEGVKKRYVYFVKEGYKVLNKHFGYLWPNYFVSLLRAGAVCLRMAQVLDKNADIPNEIPVTTKRTHLKRSEKDTHLSVAVTFHQDITELAKLHQSKVVIADTVLASGASSLAAAIALGDLGIIPDTIIHRTICATSQGMRFLRKILPILNIKPLFETLAKAREMNNHYYLVGDIVVADAGDMMEDEIPDKYKVRGR